MAICNIFNDLTKQTGNFLTFSQYTEDLTRGATQYEAYRVVPSKFIVMNIDYSNVKNTLSEEGIEGDLNNVIPKYFQNYFENGCAYLKKNYKGDWTPKHAANMFWNTLYKANMLTTTEDVNSNYFINEVRYIGDINIQSYDEKYGEGFSEIYCYIPSDAKAYKYGTIDLKPDESLCSCAPYTAEEVDDRIQYINPITELYEPFTHLNPRYNENENLEMYPDNPKIWHGEKTICECGCESYDNQEIKDALDECDCREYPSYEVDQRIKMIDEYTIIGADIPQDNKDLWSGPSEGKDGCVSYDNPEVSDRIDGINPVTMTDFGNMSDGEDGNIDDQQYRENPELWENREFDPEYCCNPYQINEIKNRIYDLNGVDIELPLDEEASIEEEIHDGYYDNEGNYVHCGCEYCSEEGDGCGCQSLTPNEIDNRIESLNSKTAVAIADDWKYLAEYKNNPNIWNDPAALEALFEEVDDYEIISEQTNTAIRHYLNENTYLEGFEGNEDYNIEEMNDFFKVYYPDTSLLDKLWIDNRGYVDPDFPNLYTFNTIIVLYEIHKIDKDGKWMLYEEYKNLPLGMYFTGKFNEDLSLTNPVTKYIDNDEIYKEGTAYGLRVCYRFAVTPNNVSIKSVNIDQENDNYSAFCQVMTEMSRTHQKMNDIVSSIINQTQYLKDTLSIYRNNKVNVPYMREINGNNYWFVNGKMIGPATVTQQSPIYIDNTTVFPYSPKEININNSDIDYDNPIRFAPVNNTSLSIKNNGYVGDNNEELEIEVDYGDVEIINEPWILTNWITEVTEIN